MTLGQDHAVTLRDGDTIIRRRLNPQEAGMGVEQEAALLRVVAEVSPVPVPQVLAISAGSSAMVMQRMRGEPLLNSLADVRIPHPERLGGELGSFLAALHSVPLDEVSALVPAEPSPLADYHADAARIAEELRGELPGHVVGPVTDFVAAPLPAPGHDLRLCHNDLGAEHVFVALPGIEITGIIDWSDASVSDPCRDLGLIWRDLGEAGFAAALARLRGDVGRGEDFVERAHFYARVKALEDFEFGLTTGRRSYAVNATRALTRLFS